MLKTDGSNWLPYKAKLGWVVKAKGLFGYLDGSKPIPVDPRDGKDSTWKPTLAEQTLIDSYPTRLDDWHKENTWVHSVIGSTISDPLYVRVHNEPTAAGVWKILLNKFQGRSQVVTIELH